MVGIIFSCENPGLCPYRFLLKAQNGYLCSPLFFLTSDFFLSFYFEIILDLKVTKIVQSFLIYFTQIP